MNRFYPAIAVCLLSLVSLFGYAQAPRWTFASGGGGSKLDIGYGAATDPAGNRYVVAYFTSDTFTVGNIRVPIRDTNYGDIVLIKYNASGTPVWAKNLASGRQKAANAIGVDRAGNLYITGQFTDTIRFGNYRLGGSANYNRFFCAKLDSGGSCLWLRGPDSSYTSYGQSLSVRPDGSVCVIGGFSGNMRFGNIRLVHPGYPFDNVFAIRYDASGNLRWVQEGYGASDVQPAGIGTDASGNVYLNGKFSSDIRLGSDTIRNSAGYAQRLFLAKLDSNGSYRWGKSPIASSGQVVVSGGIAVDPAGNLVLAGSYLDSLEIGGQKLRNSGSANGSFNTFLARFDASGNFRWLRGTDNTGDDYPNAVTMDLASNSYITGNLRNDTLRFGNYKLVPRGSAYELFVAKYDSSGTVQWAKQPDGGDNNILPEALCIGANGSVTITGNMAGSNNRFGGTVIGNRGFYDLFVATLDNSTCLQPETAAAEPLRLYPNPTTGMLTLRAVALQGASVTVCNGLGAIVYRGTAEGDTHRIDLSQQPEGLYFLRIANGETVSTGTVLIRR